MEPLGRPEALVEEPLDGGVELPVRPPEERHLMVGEVTHHQVKHRPRRGLQGEGVFLFCPLLIHGGVLETDGNQCSENFSEIINIDNF